MSSYTSKPSSDFLSQLESGSLKLNSKGLSKHKKTFDSFIGGSDTESLDYPRLLDFMEDETGIYSIGFDMQPGPRESHGGLPDGVISKIEEIYNEEPPLPLEAFVSLFLERMISGPEPTGEYESSSIVDFLDSDFEYLYVAISGSRSDRWNSLVLRPKWHYEYLICALRYCTEASEVQKDLSKLLDSPIISGHMSFLKGRGPPINFGDVESDKKELSPKEQLMAKYMSKPPDNAATIMAKEAGVITDDPIAYRNLFRVYIAVLTNMLDHNMMDLWPLGMMSGAPPANQQRTIFDLYCVSCEYFAK